MINVESRLVIVDNTKIHDGRCVHIFGGFKHKYAKVGNFILVSVKNKLENKKTRIKLYLAVITATRFNLRRSSGNYIKFDKNRIILFVDKENLLGTKILEPVNNEIRRHKLLKVPLLSRNVI
jgi:ribosomal protein L14